MYIHVLSADNNNRLAKSTATTGKIGKYCANAAPEI
jgi:hypothetical protein